MPEHEPPISLGLNTPQGKQLPPADELQFQHAVPVAAGAGEESIRRCVACQQLITDKYFHAQGQVVCPACAARIAAGQQRPPARSLLRAALYGGGAALAGCAIYATVAIVTGYELGLIAILVGYMVGKAIRYASHGSGGRPQQILAVCLTYFAITTSYIPVAIHAYATAPHPTTETAQTTTVTADSESGTGARQRMSFRAAIVSLLLLAMAAPFLSLRAGASGILSLIIILIGLRQAWKLTERPDVLVAGPYDVAPAS